MTFEENMEAWKAVAAKSNYGAAAAATGMARYITWRTARRTLNRSSHGVGAWNRTRSYEPPARGSGKLQKGMYYKAAFGSGPRKSAWVGNRVDYSRILEYGCVILPVNNDFLHWTDSGGSWYHNFLVSKPHPFLEPTVRESMDDGELQQAAIDAFRPYDP